MASSLGIQVQAERSSYPSIAPLAVARTAFVGRTLRGPLNQPVLIRSFPEFQQVFGGLWQPSLLGYSVEQFFDNGGREALIVRVANGARAASLCLPSGAGHLVLEAVRPGTREFLRACVDYDNIPEDRPDAFNLTVQRVRAQGTERVEDQEIFRSVSIRSEGSDGVAKALAASQLVRLKGQVPSERPERTLDPATGLATGYETSKPDGDDGGPLSDYDLIGSATEHTGLFALQRADHFNFLVIPPLSRDRDVGFSTLLVAARYCRQRHALLLVDPPLDWQTADDALAGIREWGLASEDAFMVFPRILAHDKLRGRFETFAPGGAVAGMLARTESLVPHWAAADAAESVLRPGHRPSCLVSEDRRAKLAAFGVNALQSVRSARATRDQRTLARGNAGAADWKYLASRRFALWVAGSIAAGTQRIAPVADQTAVADIVAAQVRDFLERLRLAGSFADRPREESYFVVATENQVVFGIAAERLGEFHGHRIKLAAGHSEVHPVTINRLTRQAYSPADGEWVDRLAHELRAQ
jgi:hypothetical protein